MWLPIRRLMARWSDPYGKGWEQGRRDAANDIKVALVRMRTTHSVVMEREYLDIEEVFDLIDQAKDPNFHPERTHP